MFNNFTWIITFKSEYSNEKLIGQSIELAKKRVVIMDANQDESIVEIKMRILWLPHNFMKGKINTFLNERYGLQVVEIIEEEIKHEKYQNLKIKNGNFLVKCKLDLKTNKQRLETGINEIDGYRVLISRIGGPVQCLTCKENGHIRRNCPRKNDKCDECKKIGHLSNECTLAKRIEDHTEELPDDSEQEMEEGLDVSSLSSKPEVNNQTDEDVDSEDDNTVYQQNEQGMIPVAQIESKLSEKNKASNTTSAISNQKDNKEVIGTSSRTSTTSTKSTTSTMSTKSTTNRAITTGTHTNQTQKEDEVDSNKRRGSIGTYLYSSNLKANDQANKKVKITSEIVNSK